MSEGARRKPAPRSGTTGLPAVPAAEGPVAVQKTYDLVLWLLRKVESFPRPYRFSVGDRIVSGALDLLLLLVEAAYRPPKRPALVDASRRVNASSAWFGHAARGDTWRLQERLLDEHPFQRRCAVR